MTDRTIRPPLERARARTALAAALLCASAVAFAQALPTASPESVGMSSERLSRIGTALKAEVDAGKLPGAVVMIARRGKLVYSTAVGHRDPAGGAPMTTDGKVEIGLR